MKTNEIITALSLEPTKQRRLHASILAEIYQQLKAIKDDVLSIDIVPKDFVFGQRGDTKTNWYDHTFEWYVIDKGDTMPGEKWTIKTKTGTYSISIPTGNTVYLGFASLFPTFITPVIQSKLIPEYSLILEDKILSEVFKAMRFIKFCKFQDWKNCVCIQIKSGKVNVLSSDGHILYKSLSFDVDFKDSEILLNINDLKKAFQKNRKMLCIEWFNDKILLNEIVTDKADFNAPDYNSVIPDYKNSIEVNRKEFINALTLVELTANKVTHQVNLHINGSIQISAEEIYFGHEGSTFVNYVRKDTIDFDYSVSAKYLLNGLKALDSKTVEIYSDGQSNKAIQLANKSEAAKILLMPIMPH